MTPAIGCGAPEEGSESYDDDEDVVSVGTTQDSLIYRSSVRWPGGVVPVCFSSLGNGGTLDKSHLQAWSKTWERVANITFTGWGDCATNTLGPNHVVITIRGNQYDGSTSKRYSSGSTVGKLDANLMIWDIEAGGNATHTDGHVGPYGNGDAVHELGHLLGFVHEHRNPAAPQDCGGPLDPENPNEDDWRVPATDAVYTPPAFDRDSIMSYCADMAKYALGSLTDTDVRGARLAYGARKTGLGVFQVATGLWAIDKNDNLVWDGAPTDYHFYYGYANHTPLSSTGYYEPVVGTFFAGYWTFDTGSPKRELSGTDATYAFGVSGQIPVLGYWHGRQSYSRLGIFDPAVAQWALDLNANGVWDGPSVDRHCYFGNANDKPAPGNFHGTNNDHDVIAVFRNGVFYIDRDDSCSWTSGDTWHSFGQAGDIPVPGDYDGNGKDNLAVFRPSNSTWYVDWDDSMSWTAADGTSTPSHPIPMIPFGNSGVVPVAMRKQ